MLSCWREKFSDVEIAFLKHVERGNLLDIIASYFLLIGLLFEIQPFTNYLIDCGNVFCFDFCRCWYRIIHTSVHLFTCLFILIWRLL